jgi:hypothetical protein
MLPAACRNASEVPSSAEWIPAEKAIKIGKLLNDSSGMPESLGLQMVQVDRRI